MAARELVLVVAVDGSPSSLRAVRYAARLALEAPSRVHVCNVQPAISVAGMMLAPSERVAEQLSGAPGDERMAEARAAFEAEGIEAQYDVLHGDAPTQIARHAKRLEADLVVVGHRGMNPVKELLLGSVALQTCELAPCPVVVAR